MVHAAFSVCVDRDIGIWSGLSLGHLLLTHAEAEALQLRSAPGHTILHFFPPKGVQQGFKSSAFPNSVFTVYTFKMLNLEYA